MRIGRDFPEARARVGARAAHGLINAGQAYLRQRWLTEQQHGYKYIHLG